MKQYKLKKWYPSLHKDWAVGDVVVPWGRQKDCYHIPNKTGIIYKEEVENNPDFWELIEEEKPLFITEDGVEVFSDIDSLFAVDLTYFSKTRNMLRSSRWLIDNPSYKVFFLESNADEYIWRNMRVFSYNDLRSWSINGGTQEEALKVAKERSEQ